MNKRRTIYRGFNKRKKRNELKIVAVAISICLIGGYGYIKLKDNKIFNDLIQKASSVSVIDKLQEFIPNKNKIEEFDYEDVSGDINKDSENKDDEKSKEASNENVNRAIVDGWDIYSVQVASIENANELNKIQSTLEENKIPFSVVEIDGVKKVQTHGTFNKESSRSYLEKIRELYPDAFLSQVKVPVLSLEYTNKYSYVNDISKQLNNLISNFKEESDFWSKNTDTPDMTAYNEILTKRREIIGALENQANKIDYEEMKTFKDDLIKYSKDVDSKIDIASKSANEQDFHISQGLLLSCMQGYLEFINSMKKA